ncbi:MAG: protein translocase subunit SecD [Thermodesulfobacteriota bacterium]
MRPIPWKAIIVFSAVIISAVLVIPTFNNDMWPYKQINLGLDLQGGMHLVMEVDTDKAVENRTQRLVTELRDELKSERINYHSVSRKNNSEIVLSIADNDNYQKFKDFKKDRFNELDLAKTDTKENTTQVMLELKEDEVKNIKKLSVAQALETIRGRIDEFGVSEPDIRKTGENRILIQLPGIDDPERAKNLIGKTAQLEFKLVDEENSVSKAVEGRVPMGSELTYGVSETGTSKTPYLLKKRTLLTGEYLTNARVNFDSQFNDPYVSIEFNAKGGRIFERITGENTQKRLAIVLDNKVYSAPVIQDKISGGKAQITGSFSVEEARDLAIVLRAGALPAPVKIIEERTVGPTLGADSIKQGLISMAVGGIIVILFMAVYYSAAGIIADIALLINILLIGAGLAAFQATLTLPGIAGIILTIGMAVDANVLIFERIREELRLGMSPFMAVSNGFDRAALTILDANVTTLIAAVVLFQFGTGPVKGFAVTLTLGILSSLFTALFVSRMIFEYIYSGKRIKKIHI